MYKTCNKQLQKGSWEGQHVKSIKRHHEDGQREEHTLAILQENLHVKVVGQ